MICSDGQVSLPADCRLSVDLYQSFIDVERSSISSDPRLCTNLVHSHRFL